MPRPFHASRGEASTSVIGAAALLLFVLLSVRAALLPSPAIPAASTERPAPAYHAAADAVSQLAPEVPRPQG